MHWVWQRWDIIQGNMNHEQGKEELNYSKYKDNANDMTHKMLKESICRKSAKRVPNIK